MELPKFLKPDVVAKLEQKPRQSLRELQAAIQTWTPFRQQAAYSLFAANPQEFSNWPEKHIIGYFLVFEGVQVPEQIEAQLRLLENCRRPFWRELLSVFFPKPLQVQTNELAATKKTPQTKKKLSQEFCSQFDAQETKLLEEYCQDKDEKGEKEFTTKPKAE